MSKGFWTHLDRVPDGPALLIPSRPHITYGELAERVAATARAMGAGKKLVAIEAALSEHSIAAYLAALAGGHAAALLPPDDDAAWLSFVERFEPELAFRKENGRWRLNETGYRPQSRIHHDLALILMTSGSTGCGKAVRLSAGAVAANASSIAQYLELDAADVGALTLPLHYSYGLSILNSHLSVGAALWVPGTSILDPAFVEEFKAAQCTNLSGVPHSYELMEQRGFRQQRYPDLRFMTVAGGRLPPSDVRLYHDWLVPEGRRFYVMYGQTEATARIAYVPPRRLPDHADGIGLAVPGGELRLVDESGTTVREHNVPGELVYRGPNVMLGYGETRHDLARGADIDELRTGDIGVRDADGLYRITGRLRRMSKIGGIRLGHDALEAALSERGITTAVVGDDELVLAAFTGAHTEAEVRGQLALAAGIGLPHARAVALEELPRLANGKLDYEQLRARMTERPSDSEKPTVATLFKEVFFPQQVLPDDCFADLGGDSLRYLEMTVGLERLLGAAPEGWEKMSVGALSARSQTALAARVISSDILLRAIAILLVVFHHATTWPIPGGAGTMFVLCGFGLARFQSKALFDGDFRRFFRQLRLVLLPYYLVVLGFSIGWGAVPWASVFLVGNLGFAAPERHEMLPYLYWFVEAFVQLLLLWALLFAPPAIRRFASVDPFRFGFILLVAATALHFASPILWPIGARQIFTLPWVLHLAVFGWCAAFASSPRRRLAVILASGVTMPLMAYTGGNWVGSWFLYGVQLPVLALLVYLPKLKVPALLAAMVIPVAAASYHIYLLHRIFPDLLLDASRPETFVSPWIIAVSVGSGLGTGLLAYRLQRLLTRGDGRFARRWQRLGLLWQGQTRRSRSGAGLAPTKRQSGALP
ncbi:AMP-binding protein [Rhizobium sp. Root1220]|uniref:AMP-binding protein n=1 Tax=Rhizobium sp. Root1220 TaxID=1736432 RepID=UPI0006F20B93|nr:AMP-binding protein [Rhizobium sp. Root1220]KQV73180.1 AMP-dependent synthetase [Rhizobium sp. Root1220]